MSRPYRQWSTDDLTFIKENVDKMPYLDIGRHLGVSYSKVQGFIARSGLSKKPKRTIITYPNKKMIQELANKGYCRKSMMKILECVAELNPPIPSS